MTQANRSLRRSWIAALVVAALAACASVDTSFKTVTFAGADADTVWRVCLDSIRAHYYGTTIRADPERRVIETDPVEEPFGSGPQRQQCYVQIVTLPSGELEVAVLATLARLEVVRGSMPPVRWKLLGSDVVVEGLLIDEIVGQVLLHCPDAKVVATTVPALPAP